MNEKPRVRKSAIPEDVVELGKKIKELMDEKDISVNSLAGILNFDTANVRRYINGQQEMKFTMIKKFANALGVEPGELFKKPKKQNLPKK